MIILFFSIGQTLSKIMIVFSIVKEAELCVRVGSYNLMCDFLSAAKRSSNHHHSFFIALSTEYHRISPL